MLKVRLLSLQSEKSNSIDSWILASLQFFSLTNQKPGTFLAPYLARRGYEVEQIGLLLFISGITALLAQTPCGQLLDHTSYKRTFASIANLLGALTSLTIIVADNFGVLACAMLIQGVSIAAIFPALYAITIGVLGSQGFGEQIPISEAARFSGNFLYALVAGLVVYFTGINSLILWIAVALGSITAVLIFSISSDKIDYHRSRGIVSVTNNSKLASYRELLGDSKLVVFFSCIFLFHFANAAMLPFLLLIYDDFLFAALAVAVAQITMGLSASFSKRLVLVYSLKDLFILTCLINPIRACVLVVMLNYYRNPIALLATQVLDGIAVGFLGVLILLILENLAR
jgi:MFS family permease